VVKRSDSAIEMSMTGTVQRKPFVAECTESVRTWGGQFKTCEASHQMSGRYPLILRLRVVLNTSVSLGGIALGQNKMKCADHSVHLAKWYNLVILQTVSS